MALRPPRRAVEGAGSAVLVCRPFPTARRQAVSVAAGAQMLNIFVQMLNIFVKMFNICADFSSQDHAAAAA